MTIQNPKRFLASRYNIIISLKVNKFWIDCEDNYGMIFFVKIIILIFEF